MKKFILLAFFYQSFVGAMAEPQPEKMYIRVVVTEGKREALARCAVDYCDEMRQRCIDKFVEESCVTYQLAEKWAYDVICEDTCDTQGCMRGFVGDKKYLESCVEILKKGLSLQAVYQYKEHQDKEPAYECVYLTDIPLLLENRTVLLENFLSASQCLTPEKMYINIVTEQKREALTGFSVALGYLRGISRNELIKKGFSTEEAEKRIDETVRETAHDSQEFMRGFMGDKRYLESCVETLKKELDLQVMYHYQEPARQILNRPLTVDERGCYKEPVRQIEESDGNIEIVPACEHIGLTDVPAFLAGAAYLQASESPAAHLSQHVPVPIEMKYRLF